VTMVVETGVEVDRAEGMLTPVIGCGTTELTHSLLTCSLDSLCFLLLLSVLLLMLTTQNNTVG
jgi:hypothetical protein